MTLFVGRAPVSLPTGPVFTPPDTTADGATVTVESSATTITGLNSDIAAAPDGSVIGLVAASTITGGASDQITLTSRHAISVVGRGATIQRTARGTDEIIQLNGLCTDIAWYDTIIEGANPSPGVWNVTYENEHGFAVRSATNVEISGCSVVNVGGDGLYVAGLLFTDKWSKNVRFHHGAVSGTGRMGLSITDGGRDVVFDFNTLDHIAYYGFDIEPNGLTIDGIAAGAINARFSDNAFGVQPYGTDTGGQPVGYAMAITGSSGGGPGNQVQFLRNTFAHGAMRIGVFNNGGTRQDINVSNNTAVDSFTAGAVSKCMQFGGVAGLTVINNVQPCTVDADFISTSSCSGTVVTTPNTI